MERNEVLVSYDVKNLYPFIPIDEALKLVERLLCDCRTIKNVTNLSALSIMELLRWMFGLTYCEFDGKHYALHIYTQEHTYRPPIPLCTTTTPYLAPPTYLNTPPPPEPIALRSGNKPGARVTNSARLFTPG